MACICSIYAATITGRIAASSPTPCCSHHPKKPGPARKYASLVFALVAVLGPGLGNIILVLGLTGWERYARVVRAEVLALREREFVQAARAIGMPTPRIIFRHIMPNTFSSVIVLATLQTAQAILAEAALSFLGLGTGQTYPSWGQMIALGRDYVNVAWWLSTFPGIAILLTVLAINLIGDRVRDVLDPRVT